MEVVQLLQDQSRKDFIPTTFRLWSTLHGGFCPILILPLAWQQITSDAIVLEEVRQGYSFHFMERINCLCDYPSWGSFAQAAGQTTGTVGRGVVPPVQEGYESCAVVARPRWERFHSHGRFLPLKHTKSIPWCKDIPYMIWRDWNGQVPTLRYCPIRGDMIEP